MASLKHMPEVAHGYQDLPVLGTEGKTHSYLPECITVKYVSLSSLSNLFLYKGSLLKKNGNNSLSLTHSWLDRKLSSAPREPIVYSGSDSSWQLRSIVVTIDLLLFTQ